MKPFSGNQEAYQTGRSTEMTISTVMFILQVQLRIGGFIIETLVEVEMTLNK